VAGAQTADRKKPAKGKPLAGGRESRPGYFLALQVGQVEQVEWLSVQHFMPQDACFLASHLEQDAQPLKSDTTPTSAAHRARVLMSFIWIRLGLFHAASGV